VFYAREGRLSEPFEHLLLAALAQAFQELRCKQPRLE
jgi:hypothetical protein